MANPPKKKGTARETQVVGEHTDRGLEAHRDENNSASSDVIVRTRGGPVRVEVKDRQNLNAHKLMKDMLALYPDDLNVLWWHRTSKKNGNKRTSPDGPDLVHLLASDWLQVAVLLDRVGAAVREADRAAYEGDPGYAVQLLEWVADALPAQMGATRD